METVSLSSAAVLPKPQGTTPLPIKRTSSESVPLREPRAPQEEVEQQLANADAKRLDRLRQAATSFAVSDQRFTIYKDLSGQFITRFTSLRDGKVTYIPEPDLLSWLNQSSSAMGPNLSLEI